MPTNATQPPYTARTTTRSADRCLNWIPEKAGGGVLFRTRRGMPTAVTLSTGGSTIRGLAATATGNDLFAVNGTRVFRASNSFAAALSLTLTTSSGHVQMADNGTYVFLCSPTTASGTSVACYLTPGSSTMTDITTATAPGLSPVPVAVRYLGGYLVACAAVGSNAGRLQYSANNTDPTIAAGAAVYTWPALNYATAQSCPDGLVALEVLHDQLYLAGTGSLEVWSQTGDANTPFAPTPGAPITVGCVGKDAIAATTQAVYWMAATPNGQPSIYRTVGYQAERLSTPLIETYLAGWQAVYVPTMGSSTVTAQVVDVDGHVLIVWAGTSGSTDGPAICYDETTGMWHEQAMLVSAVQSPAPFRCHAVYQSGAAISHYWGGDDSGKLYVATAGTPTDASSVAITRLRAWPEFPPGFNRTRWDQLEALTNSTTAATLTATWSDDNGQTTKTQDADVSGGVGRANWQRLGMSRQRNWQISTVSTVLVDLLDTDLRTQVGAS